MMTRVEVERGGDAASRSLNHEDALGSANPFDWSQRCVCTCAGWRWRFQDASSGR